MISKSLSVWENNIVINSPMRTIKLISLIVLHDSWMGLKEKKNYNLSLIVGTMINEIIVIFFGRYQMIFVASLFYINHQKNWYIVLLIGHHVKLRMQRSYWKYGTLINIFYSLASVSFLNKMKLFDELIDYHDRERFSRVSFGIISFLNKNQHFE